MGIMTISRNSIEVHITGSGLFKKDQETPSSHTQKAGRKNQHLMTYHD